jgi:hypothetical protein
MSNDGFTTPNQPIRSRSPATPRRHSLRVTQEELNEFLEFDALVARNPVPVLALPPWTPVRQNAIRAEDLPPAAPRRIVRAGLRRSFPVTPGGEPSLSPSMVATPPPVPRIRRARSPRSSSTEPPAKRTRYEE